MKKLLLKIFIICINTLTFLDFDLCCLIFNLLVVLSLGNLSGEELYELGNYKMLNAYDNYAVFCAAKELGLRLRLWDFKNVGKFSFITHYSPDVDSIYEYEQID